jgi:hypothetical protein
MAGTAPLKSLNAATAPGAGTTFDVQRATSNWEVQITTTGAPASFAAHLEGAIDGSTLVTIGSSITTTGLTNVTSNTPLTQVRLVLDSLTGGTAPTVTGVIVGDGPAGTSGGGGGAATIAAGADVTEGNTTDAKVTGDNAGTVSAKLRGLLYEFGDQADAAAGTDAGTFSFLAFVKRLLAKFTTQFPAALTGSGNLKVSLAESTASQAVTNANLDAALSTLVPTTDFDSKTGSLTEAAPASDTASSGLNGRLQRIAQRLTSLIALLPSALVSGRLDVNVGATVTPANVALDATVTTTNTEIGGLTEAAPASDTASSGLNGRLQRVAQRLTSLIALLPSALISNRLDVNLGAAPATVTAQGTAADNTTATGNPVMIGVVSTGGNVRTLLSVGSDGLGVNQVLGAAALNYNGATMDRARNNVDVTLLASAARTTTQGPTTITMYNLGAVKFVLDMTTVGTGSVTLTINEVDPASGKSILLLSGAAVTTNSTNEYTVDPMIPAVTNVSAQKRCPRTLSYTVTANNANSAVYSLGCMELPA